MSEGWYEVVALAARYVFLALAVGVVLLGWKSHRAALKASAQSRKEGAAIGEMRIIGDISGKLDGKTYPVPMEGVIGSARSCDIRVKSRHVRRRHVYFEQRQGCLLLSPIGSAGVSVQGKENVRKLLFANADLFSEIEQKVRANMGKLSSAEEIPEDEDDDVEDFDLDLMDEDEE